jgi:DNA sulfur modification protein DndE
MKAPYRVALSENATSLLRSLTQKTGLSANILARFAMLISFEDKSTPANDAGKPDLVINRTSLFGDLEPFIMAAFSLTKGSASTAGKDIANHIARGAAFLNVRVESVPDFIHIVNDLS